MSEINLSNFINTAYTGFTGSRGFTGSQGIAGDTGFVGSQGDRSEVIRVTLSETTATLADESTESLSLAGFKSYFLYKVQTSAPSWVRIYSSESARNSDISRTINTDPDISIGIIAEVITTSSDPVLISPAVVGFNNESPPTTDIPILITNKSGSTQEITVDLTIVSIEND